MRRFHDRIPSEAMGRALHVWRFGHFGVPLLVFPSASGLANEWLDRGMLDALRELVDGGRIKLFCTESNVAEAWTRRESPPAWRLERHAAFEHYVLRELLPRIRSDCRTPDIGVAVAGTSLGAFYAANLALKHPETFPYALCMSGRYDVAEFTRGDDSLAAYFNNPMAYVPNLHGVELRRVREHTHLTLVCGQGRWEDGNVEEARSFAGELARKGIPHELDLWGHDVSHEWPWWQRQAQHHLGRRFG